MLLHPREIPPIPEETMRVARAVLPRGNIYIRTGPLRWRAVNERVSAASPHGRSPQRGSVGRVVAGHAPSENPLCAFCRAAGGRRLRCFLL
jgi:hypothetical protein